MPIFTALKSEDVPEEVTRLSQHALMHREWVRNNPEKTRALARGHYTRNRETILATRSDYRANHIEERDLERRHYYDKSRLNTSNARQPWMLHEIKEIMDPKRPLDRILSRRLGRSIRAIQVMRSRCKKD